MQQQKDEELWVSWTLDAMEHYEASDDVGDNEDMVNDMADFTTGYADAMLAEYKERFDGGGARRRAPRKSKKPETEE